MKKILITSLAVLFSLASHSQQLSFQEKAALTLKAIYANYSVEGTPLLLENFPHDESHRVTFLANEWQEQHRNRFAFLWPFSGTISAVTALYEVSRNPIYRDLLHSRVLPALAKYFDTRRYPPAYGSYLSSAPKSDRFYDDNVWIGLDFVDLYNITGEQYFLDRAKLVWNFVMSGKSETLGGGIYWNEQCRTTKNTCSNAPGAVYAFKLFEATGDSTHFHTGVELFYWTKENLQDDDFIFLDYIRLDGHIDRRRFTYNSGQMIQAAAILYRLTGDPVYLTEAQNIARASFDYFFDDFVGEDGEEFRLIRRGDTWFTAIMLRGFIELYHIDGNRTYINTFKKNLEYAWRHARNEYGLFTQDFSGRRVDRRKWLLAQAGMAEMYARLSAFGR